MSLHCSCGVIQVFRRCGSPMCLKMTSLTPCIYPQYPLLPCNYSFHVDLASMESCGTMYTNLLYSREPHELALGHEANSEYFDMVLKNN